jgi:hypothetical protein
MTLAASGRSIADVLRKLARRLGWRDGFGGDVTIGRLWCNCGKFDDERADVVLPVIAWQAQQVIATKNRLLSDS